MASGTRVYATEIVFKGDTVSSSGVNLGYINGGSVRHTQVRLTVIDYTGQHHSHCPTYPFSPWMEACGNMERNPLPECAWRGTPNWAINAADDYAEHNRL